MKEAADFEQQVADLLMRNEIPHAREANGTDRQRLSALPPGRALRRLA